MADSQAMKIDSLEDLEKEPGGDYDRWSSEIEMAEKELDKWQKKARRIVKEYRADRSETSITDPSMQRKFNLFSANVNILSTSLINQNPEISVDREFKDKNDPIGRVACQILERAVSAHNNRNFKTYNLVKQAVQDMLVPGVGTTWHTYHAETETKTIPPTPEELQLNPQAQSLEYDDVVSEQIQDEYVYWEDILWSPARCWDEIRWIARKVYMTRDELVERFGKEKGEAIPLNFAVKKNEGNRVDTRNLVFQQSVVYEIWCKEKKEVIWYVKGMDRLLEKKPDYLELDDFYPCPRFMFANLSNGQMIPIPDYEYARDQYRELNEVNTRLGLLVRACRLAGVYDKSNQGIKDLANNAAENTLIAVDQWAAFAEKGGIKGVVDWLPLEQITVTIEQLMKAREDLKNQIYEITGMADIIRGQTKATETLGAQKLKAQYASMRIQDRQKVVVIFCSSVFDLQVQLMRKHVSVEVIAELAQVQFMGESQEMIIAGLQLIKSPDFVLRARVTSDTLSDIDFQAEKQDRMEYMTAITNYFKEVGQLITTDPVMGPLLMELLKFSLAGFKIGKKFEGELERTFQQVQQKLAQPQQPQMTPEQAKAAEIQQKMQADQQDRQDERQHKQAMQGIELQGKQTEAAVDTQIANQKLQQSRVEFAERMQQRQIENQMGVQNGPQNVPVQ